MAAKEVAQSSNRAALDAALVALRNHVDGTDTLSNTDLPTKAAIVKQHGSLLKQGGSYLTKAFDLVSGGKTIHLAAESAAVTDIKFEDEWGGGGGSITPPTA